MPSVALPCASRVRWIWRKSGSRGPLELGGPEQAGMKASAPKQVSDNEGLYDIFKYGVAHGRTRRVSFVRDAVGNKAS